MHAADFRHGPLEVVDRGFAALIFAGANSNSVLSRDLAREIQSNGGRVFWVDSSVDPEIPTVLLPQTGDLTRPLLEILPMHRLTLVMARRKGLEAGHFRPLSKGTTRE